VDPHRPVVKRRANHSPWELGQNKTHVTDDDRLQELPPALRAVLDAELAAGNTVASVFDGFPAPPFGGGCVMLGERFRAAEETRAGLDWRRRQSSTSSGELTDVDRRWFILTPPDPADAAYPDMDAIRAERERAVAEADAERMRRQALERPQPSIWLWRVEDEDIPERRPYLSKHYTIKIDHRGEMITYIEPTRSATIICTFWDSRVSIARRTLSSWWYPAERKSEPMTPEEADTAFANILQALHHEQGISKVEEE